MDTVLRIDAFVGGVNRGEISRILRSSYDVRVDFVDSSLQQHLDGPTAASIASVILGIVQLVMALRSNARSDQRSVDRLKKEVGRAAAELTGTDEISEL